MKSFSFSLIFVLSFHFLLLGNFLFFELLSLNTDNHSTNKENVQKTSENWQNIMTLTLSTQKKSKLPVKEFPLKAKKNLQKQTTIIEDQFLKSETLQPKNSDSQNEHKMQAYLKQVNDLLEKNKFFPRKAKVLGHKGLVKVTFTIRPDGKLKVIQDIDSHYSSLKDAVVELITSRIQYPATPLEDEVTITASLDFTI